VKFPVYPRAGASEPLELPQSQSLRHSAPRHYLPDQGLIDAVNVALYLGQPLLLTGKPGTGKTQLAYHLAYDLGMGKPLKFEAKTTSQASDLFYTFDSLRSFHERDPEGKRPYDHLNYLHYNALGEAILVANEPDDVASWLTKDLLKRHRRARRSVVLIDEIDKAPRDFPNDILNEIEKMEFTVPLISPQPVNAPEGLRPILVLTSNSEKHLPEAFLRRCVYYDIPFPDDARLRKILAERIPEIPADSPLLEEAIQFFGILRADTTGLRKGPATAELLGWLDYLRVNLPAGSVSLKPEYWEVLRASLSAVVKDSGDQKTARRELRKWLKLPEEEPESATAST
jgi:MoxR-like ATPase